MMKIQWTRFLAAACIAFSCNPFATAGVITGQYAPASGPGLGFASIAAVNSPNPNNDNVSPRSSNDNNVVVPFKRFDAAGYIDIPFLVSVTNGVTEYSFTEFVDNNSGIPWSGLRMELGINGTTPDAPLLPIVDLDFDAPDYDSPPSSNAFSFVATPNPQTLLFTGGTHGAGAQQYTFRVDVPDNFSRGPNVFILRETPIPANIPEPGCILLAAVACGLAGPMRRRG